MPAIHENAGYSWIEDAFHLARQDHADRDRFDALAEMPRGWRAASGHGRAAERSRSYRGRTIMPVPIRQGVTPWALFRWGRSRQRVADACEDLPHPAAWPDETQGPIPIMVGSVADDIHDRVQAALDFPYTE